MVNTYKITVKNQTGAPQNYSFFSATPIVSGGNSGDVWSNVLKTAPQTPNGAVATLEVWSNYYAVCGSFDGDPNQGVRISTSKCVPATLGYKSGDNIVMGSSIPLKVINKETCDLGAPKNPGAGKIECFELTTATNEFTYQEAINS
jgi:hypothetical protein